LLLLLLVFRLTAALPLLGESGDREPASRQTIRLAFSYVHVSDDQ